MTPGGRSRVSFDDEPLVLVDAADRVLGHASKALAHRGRGLLHRAFSIVLYAPDGAVLLQRRAAAKALWPGYWSNSCCSHPRRGESYEEAVHRRLIQELGVDTDLDWIYRFQYQARYGEVGAERELCSVYVGVIERSAPLAPHPEEIDDWAWAAPAALDRAMAETPERFTPWFRLEWRRLRALPRSA
jgi:isopentenyl-diphosphate delta-isomerase